MKYGLITFNKTQNIGDDIQSYAAIKYLPQIDYYIEREALNEFVPEKNEIVTTIMNGWYLHDIYGMPPSPFLNPLITSIHLTNHLEDKCPEYLSGIFIEYLKKNQLIGCRDNLVRKYLSEQGVENFFSGCLTLTIEKFADVEKKDYICAVDIEEELVEKIKEESKCEVVELTHEVNIEDNSKLSYEIRMKNVEELLKKYQAAKCVITNRLHCVLPCLALGTPVLLINNTESIDVKNRLGDYLEMLNHMTKDDFLGDKGTKYLKEIPENKKDYLKYRESLNKQVKEFIEKSKTLELKPKIDCNLYKEYFVNQKKYLKSNLNTEKRKMYDLQKQIENYNLELKNRVQELEVENRKIKMQLKASEKENSYMKSNIKKKNKELKRIKNMKIYKGARLLGKIKNKITFWRK